MSSVQQDLEAISVVKHVIFVCINGTRRQLCFRSHVTRLNYQPVCIIDDVLIECSCSDMYCRVTDSLSAHWNDGNETTKSLKNM
jgi:hypothetical protein